MTTPDPRPPLGVAPRPSRPTGRDRRRGRFVMVAGVASAGLAPWIVVLAVILPRRFVSSHWTLTWVGFDIGLLIALLATTLFAMRRSRRIVPAAGLTAGLLCCDAWFDITTSHPGGLAVSVASAVCLELPLAGLLLYVAELVQREPAPWIREPSVHADAEATPSRRRATDPTGPDSTR